MSRVTKTAFKTVDVEIEAGKEEQVFKGIGHLKLKMFYLFTFFFLNDNGTERPRIVFMIAMYLKSPNK